MIGIAAELAEMAVVDVRDGGPVRHARERSDQARGLRDACFAIFPRAAAPLLPLLDATARRWLVRSQSPYVPEIAAIAALLDVSGIWLLNCSYQWGCTALAREEGSVPWLVRTLDWPFSGLGRYADVAQMRGEIGDYFSITWPGYAGALTAMAPGRFAACINQAPLWRRTQHPWLRVFDHAMNGLRIWATIRHMPPDQLLRRAFEVCDNYGAARRMLETTPVARPVIYTLIGCESGECCVIERGENDFRTREDETCTANDWMPSRPHWEGRIAAKDLFTQSRPGAAAKNRARREALAGWNGRLCDGPLDWVTPPVLNPYTRLAIAMNPSRAILRVTGYESGDADLPQPVTQVCLPGCGRDEVIASASAPF